MRPAVFSWPTAVTTAICTAQTTAGAGALTIDGTLLDLAETTYGVRRVVLPGIQRVVTLTSAADIHTVNVTITGKDLRGATVTETRAAPTANTVATTAEFHEITSITVDAAVGTGMSVGTGNTGSTNWFMCSNFANPASITVAIALVTGTISATVQNTLADVQAGAPASGEIFDHPTIAAATAKAESNYAFPPRFVRAINASGAGSFDFTIIQTGL